MVGRSLVYRLRVLKSRMMTGMLGGHVFKSFQQFIVESSREIF
jgi:hypothetical protein